MSKKGGDWPIISPPHTLWAQISNRNPGMETDMRPALIVDCFMYHGGKCQFFQKFRILDLRCVSYSTLDKICGYIAFLIINFEHFLFTQYTIF